MSISKEDKELLKNKDKTHYVFRHKKTGLYFSFYGDTIFEDCLTHSPFMANRVEKHFKRKYDLMSPLLEYDKMTYIEAYRLEILER